MSATKGKASHIFFREAETVVPFPPNLNFQHPEEICMTMPKTAELTH